MLGISYRVHETNEYVWQQVDILGRHQELLLSTVKHHKLSWFGHVCHCDTLQKIILQRTVDGSRHRGRPRKSWEDNIKNGQASKCHHCCTSQMTEVDEQSPQQMRLLEYAKDALVSLVLIYIAS